MNVDAGLCWVGDPCYVIGKDASHAEEKWSDFCDKIPESMSTHTEPLGDGVGFAVSTGYGDGSYPVYIETVDGIGGGERVSSITIEFLKDEEEDEEEDEEDLT